MQSHGLVEWTSVSVESNMMPPLSAEPEAADHIA